MGDFLKRHGKDHASWISGIHAKGMRFFASVLSANVVVLNFSCRAWSLFVWCCCCHHYQKRWSRALMPCWLLSSRIIITSHLTPSALVTDHNIFPHLQVEICNAGIEETVLAVYWVIDGVDRCWVGFTSWHLVKHRDKFDCALAQAMEVYIADDVSKQKRQKVYKSFGFAMMVLISKVGNARRNSKMECNKATKFKK